MALGMLFDALCSNIAVYVQYEHFILQKEKKSNFLSFAAEVHSEIKVK